jgi:3-oxoacyl-[acyl-carrier protein] reductase
MPVANRYPFLVNALQGKTALVTGSSRGIGRAVALALAQAGADIVLNYRTRQTEAQALKLLILRQQRRCIAVQADVSVRADVERLIRSAEEGFGSVGVLVNNAGISRPEPIEEITQRDWDHLIEANLKSCFLVTQAVLPGMRARQWGRNINLSSVVAQVGGVVGPHYAASKKARMIGLTHFYAMRLAKEGITVNAIAPALVETERVTSNPNARADRIPIGRYGSPDKIADVAGLLA